MSDFMTTTLRTAMRTLVIRRASRSGFRLLLSMALMGTLVAIAAGCGGDDDDEAERPTQPTTAEVTEYVGALRGVDAREDFNPGDYFIAVAIDDAGKAEAYACDATGNAHLFSGEVEGERLELSSETGDATLSASVSDASVDGDIDLEGERLAFATTEARGIGGLYTLSKQPGDKLTGSSERGNEISSEYLPDERAVETTVTLASGEQRSLPGRGALRPRSPAEARAFKQQARFRDYRVIVLDSGIAKGNKTITSKSAPSGTSDWSATPVIMD